MCPIAADLFSPPKALVSKQKKVVTKQTNMHCIMHDVGLFMTLTALPTIDITAHVFTEQGNQILHHLHIIIRFDIIIIKIYGFKI